MDVSIRPESKRWLKAQREVEAQIREDGENAALDVGVHGIHPELQKLLGYEVPFKLWTECFKTFY